MFKYWKVSGKTTAKSPKKLLFWTCSVVKNWMFKNWTFSWVFNFWNKTENSPYKRRRRKEYKYYPRYYSDRSGRKNNTANTKCRWRSMNSSPQRLAGLEDSVKKFFKKRLDGDMSWTYYMGAVNNGTWLKQYSPLNSLPDSIHNHLTLRQCLL